MRSRLAWCLMLGVAIGFGDAPATAAPQDQPARDHDPPVDPSADAILQRMSTTLAGLRAFRVKADSTTEVVRENGRKLQLATTNLLTVERPNNLRTDELGSSSGRSLYYDGRVLTVYSREAGYYASTRAPSTIAYAIDFARDQLGIEAPAADLWQGDSYRALMRDTLEGEYVGPEVIDGQVCQHLAYRGRDADWQIWVKDGPIALPCRYVITSKDLPGEPQYMVELREWNFEPELPRGTFTFLPPAGAERIDFRKQSQQNQTSRP